MSRSHRALGTTLGLFCTALQLCSQAAHAQDASAAETAAARALAVDGLKLAQAGNCSEAIVKLERAEKLYHAPVVAIRLGECYVSVGRLVEGTEILRKSLREPVSAEPNPNLQKALERAQRVLDGARPRIAGLTIKIAAVDQLSVRIDGDVLAVAMLETEVPSDPGEHTIEASAPGFLKATTRVSVGDAEKKTVTMTLTRDPNAAVASSATPAPAPSGDARSAAAGSASPSVYAPPPAATAPAAAPNRTGAYLALGVGAVGIGVGSALGIMTLQQRSEMKTTCPGDVCPPSQQDALDSAKRLGNFSTIAFGVGGAGLVLGTVLYFSAGSGSSSTDRASRLAHQRLVSGLRADVGPGSVQLSGQF
jgi:hypothetical protein